MPHSYEELRTAAFDVLAKRVPVTYDPSQYRHLTIGVATALLERYAPTKPQHHSVYPRDASLEPEDADPWVSEARLHPEHSSNIETRLAKVFCYNRDLT